MASNVIEFTLKGVDAFSKPMSSVASSITSVGKASIKTAKWATAAGVAVVGFTKVMADGQDKAGKFATRIGVAVDQLTAMQHAADLSGISTEQFNMATQRMTRRVAEASQGLGEAKDALKELGIDAQSFKSLKLEDQFATLADAMENVNEPADRLRLGFKLFDSEGTSMLQMLDKGSDSMKRMAEDARLLGLVVSDQAAANSAAFNDSLTRLQGSITGISRGIANEFMPTLTGMANHMANFLATNRDNIVQWAKDSVKSFFVFFEMGKQIFEGIGKLFTDTRAMMKFLDFIGIAFKGALNIGWANIKMLAVALREGFKAMASVVLHFGAYIKDSVASWFGGPEVESFSKRMSFAFVTAIENAKGPIAEQLKSTVDIYKDALSETGAALYTALDLNLAAATARSEEYIVSLQEFGTVMAQEALKATEDTKNNQEQLVTELKNFSDTATNSISHGLARVVTDSKNAATTVKNVAVGLTETLIAGFIKQGIQRAVLSNTNNALVGKETSVGMGSAAQLTYARTFSAYAGIPGAGTVLAPAMAAQAVATMLTGASAAGASGIGANTVLAGARADGGPVTAGRSYLVGERGPEIFTPGASGGITANENMGGVNIQNLTIHILENATSAEALLQMGDIEIQELIAQKIIPGLNALQDLGVTPNIAQRIERI